MLESAGKTSAWDIKLMRGGLVEIEFIAQGLQLVHAHASPGVLNRNTIKALDALHGAGCLEAANHQVLVNAARLYHINMS